VKYGETVIRYRWFVIAAMLSFLAFSASGIARLEIASDVRLFFSDENPQLKALEELENVYTKEGNVLIVLAPADGNVFTREFLTALEKYTEKAWQVPFSLRVDSITNFQNTRAQGDELIVEDLVRDAGSLTDAQIEEIKRTALNEPLLRNRLVSSQGHVAGINVNVIPTARTVENLKVANFAKKMAAEFEAEYPGSKAYLTGGVMIDNAYYEATTDDILNFVPVMLALMILTTYAMIRSVSGTDVTLVIISSAAVTALGLTGWLGIKVSPSSAGAPVIVLTLAVADSIHVLTTMFFQMKNGLSKHDAIVESLRINMQPIFLTSITTAVGFLSMNFSDAPPFHDLGNTVAIGVMGAYMYSVLLIPALMSMLPVKVKAGAGSKRPVMERFGDFVVEYRRPLFWGVLAFMLVLASGIPKIVLNDSFVDYFDERYKFRTDTDFVEKNLTGLNIIEYSIGSGEEGGIMEPAYLRKLDEFARWYKKQPKVAHVGSIVDIMKRLNKNMHNDDEAFYRVPENRQLAAQYLLLYEMSLPFGRDLNNMVNVDKSASRFTAFLNIRTTMALQEMERKGNQWLKENAPPEMHAAATGLSVMFSHLSERNIRSMLRGTAFALVMISAILMVALGSVRIGVASLVPNLVPAVLTYGLWGHLVGEIGLAVSVIAAITLGIVVDDTVHFLSKYLRARREMGLNPPDAVRYSFRTVGNALFTTSLVLVAGFMVLASSGFMVNSSMGLLTAITITFALMADFLFLPPLLMKWDKKEAASAGR